MCTLDKQAQQIQASPPFAVFSSYDVRQLLKRVCDNLRSNYWQIVRLADAARMACCDMQQTKWSKDAGASWQNDFISMSSTQAKRMELWQQPIRLHTIHIRMIKIHIERSKAASGLHEVIISPGPGSGDLHCSSSPDEHAPLRKPDHEHQQAVSKGRSRFGSKRTQVCAPHLLIPSSVRTNFSLTKKPHKRYHSFVFRIATSFRINILSHVLGTCSLSVLSR